MRGTTSYELCFIGSNTILQGYVDADMEGDKDSRRSTTRYIFTVGATPLTWIYKLQNVVTLSTMEVDYVSTTEASKEMIWLQRITEELGKKQARIAGCTTAAKVSFIFQRSHPFIRILNI